jgi:uncharacterized protein
MTALVFEAIFAPPTVMRILSPLEARVLGVLVEKQLTVPDAYPLSVNALVVGCNQKTARYPVIETTEAEVVLAIEGLKTLSLVFEGPSARVVKYEHNTARVLRVPSQSVALLAVLMLRGPQTSAELRLACERLHRFADVSSVEGFLDELAARSPPLVLKLPRAPGAREHRWAHVLCGEPVHPAANTGAAFVGETMGDSLSVGEWAALRAEQTRLADEVQVLKAQLQLMAQELGMTLPDAHAADKSVP